MKTSFLGMVFGLLATAVAFGQPPHPIPNGALPPPAAPAAPAINPALSYPPPSGVYAPVQIAPRATTVPGSISQGAADVIRARGEFNYLTSQAAIFANQARALQLQNARDYVHTYFDLRQANRLYRAAERGPRPGPEAWIRYAQAARPDRLSPAELDAITGRINWPILLQADEFARYRAELEALFATRADLGGINTWGYLRIDQTSKALLEQLKGRVADFPPQDYIQARRFLEALAYEAKYPAG